MRSQRWAALAALVVLCSAIPLLAADTPQGNISTDLLTKLCAVADAATTQAHVNNQLIAHPGTACNAGAIGCGQTVSGRVGAESCFDLTSDVYGVGYTFNGIAGQAVTIAGTSYEFTASIALADARPGNGTIYARGDVVAGYTARISNFTLPYTGPYFVLITPGYPDTFGNYTIMLTCSSLPGPSSGSCAPDSRTACLLNNRFKATVRYRHIFDNNAADTDALVKSVTGFASASYETAFFYFNSANNIEMMIKMLDQGNTNSAGQPTIAVLFGSATPLRMELTITDMQTGIRK